MRNRLLRTLGRRFCLFALLASLPCSLAAQAPRQDLSVDELVKGLTPARPATRGLRNLKVEPARIDLLVHFEFDLARLQPATLPQLQRLATAMNREPISDFRFQVEGHTDAKGEARYNKILSEKRANAVVDYLVSQGVSLARLSASGKGFEELIDRDNPLAAENRRVRIQTME